jgi:hypothetical protein
MVKIIQRIVIIGSLIVSGLFFIYTLGFSTPWANGFRYGEGEGGFFTVAQQVNHLMFPWGFWTLVCSLLGFIFQSHKTRHFYFWNYLFLGATIYCSVNAAMITLENVPPLKEVYLNLDLLSHRIVLSGAALRPLFPTDMPVAEIVQKIAVIFDVGPWIAYALLTWAALLAFLAVLKTVIRIVKTIERRRWEEGRCR